MSAAKHTTLTVKIDRVGVVENLRHDVAAQFRAMADQLDALSPITLDGSGSVPPLNDPDPSPTPAEFAVIVTLGEDLPAGTQLWVRRETWGELAVDERPTPGSSWSLGQFSGLTVEEAP